MFEVRKIKALEKEADINISTALSDTERDVADLKNEIEKVHLDYIALRERYKHDKRKLVEIAIDWKDFAENCFLNNSAWDVQILASGDGDNERMIKETEVRMEQIAERFKTLLT